MMSPALPAQQVLRGTAFTSARPCALAPRQRPAARAVPRAASQGCSAADDALFVTKREALLAAAALATVGVAHR